MACPAGEHERAAIARGTIARRLQSAAHESAIVFAAGGVVLPNNQLRSLATWAKRS